MEKMKSLHIDMAQWESLKVDDFLVAVGKTKSNSVYHIAEIRSVPKLNSKVVRHHVKVFKSDLITMLRRGSDQGFVVIKWYSRNKKK